MSDFTTSIATRITSYSVLMLVVFVSLGVAQEPSPSKIRKSSYQVRLKSPGASGKSMNGFVVAEGLDGGCLFQENNGRLHLFVAKETESIEKTATPFEPLTSAQISAQMLAELPKGFRATSTKHYVICYNTTEAYAKWNGALYERLLRGFYTYWKRLGVELHEPEFPLVAVVFENRDNYVKYAKGEDVLNAESMIGYYNLLSNRIAGYDLTGVEGMIPKGKSVNTAELINHILAQRSAERLVATVVHEAVHQLSYNSGLQTRLCDNPIAISEGLAMFFESPDLSNATGWGGIGKINGFNYDVFRKSFNSRQSNSLLKLLQDDSRFQDSSSATAAYGESWALTYFLLKTRSKEYAAYMTELSRRPPLEPTDPKRRIADFQKFFGQDLEKLDREFVKYMSRL
ncbi:MAG: DUF1570 domain-containing protein [Pirellulaceae bacterium]|nr:DUF1570 domain-containing protein [Pirellulaceae bacterium]